jgi:uncharacterized protein (DUF2141 family)
MFRKLLFISVSFLIIDNLFSGDIYTTVEINGVTVNGGLLYVAIYSTEDDYKNETAFVNFILQPNNTTLTHFLNLPEGEYVVSVFQDKNGDEKLNSGIFGIPTEHVGKTNYSLKGSPGGFNKLKSPVNDNSTKLIVNVGRVKPLGII